MITLVFATVCAVACVILLKRVDDHISADKAIQRRLKL